MFARLIKLKEEIGKLVKSATALLIGISLIVAIASSFFANDLLGLIYSHQVAETTIVFPWIIMSFVPICAAYVFGTLLTASGQLRLLNRIALSGIGINVVLNLLLIPTYKAEGAAIATCITQVMAGLGQVLLAARLFRLKWNISLISRLIVFVIALTGLGLGNHFFLELRGILAFILFALVGTSLLFLMRIVHVREIVHIMKEKI